MKEWKDVVELYKENEPKLNWEAKKGFAKSTMIEFVRRLGCTQEVIPGFIHYSEVMRVFDEMEKELEAK